MANEYITSPGIPVVQDRLLTPGWQYRYKPDDVADRQIHLEELNPKTGAVTNNYHLRWPEGTGRGDQR